MLRQTYLLLCLLLINFSLLGQSYKVKGLVTDTTGNALILSTVMLLESDSTLLDYAQTDMQGYFVIDDIAQGQYLIKVNYLGYIPQTIPVSLADQKTIDLGQVKLTEIAEELMEVVIKAAKAPMKMRGDTIEYDATTFQVPEGSTIEDLLRRLPGVEVDQDGSLKADGKDISKVTVEGKDFFGGDPKTVTKNLPAEGVSKVQVFDRKSEEEKLTGIKKASEEKEMNIELKEDFKSGGFGKIIVGGGSEKRGEVKGNYNKFNSKHQFSLIGVLNNTGRNGLSWDDYQDFMGAQAFNFGNTGLEYGFGSNAGFRTFSFGGSSNNELENKISNAFFSGNNGGFPESLNGGINYNYDHDKTQFGSTYFYNFAGNNRVTNSETNTFFNNFSTDTERSDTENTNFDGHRGEFKFTQEIDSFHSVTVTTDLAYVLSDRDNFSTNQILRNGSDNVSSSEVDNDFSLNGQLVNSTIILRKTFRKKGRFLGVNAGFLYTDVDENSTLNSQISFFENNTIDSVAIIQQLNSTVANKNSINANVMFSEPLSKTFFFSVFANMRRTAQEGTVDIKDAVDSELVENALLSRDYENGIEYYRAGTTITYANEGLNITAGAGYQSNILKADFRTFPDSPILGTVDQPFNNFVPYFDLSYNINRTSRFSISYNKNIQEPRINDLLPIINNSNPLFIRSGNPELQPETSHTIRFNTSSSVPASGIRLYANGSYELFTNQVISEEIVDENLITTSRPINYDGGSNFRGYLSSSFPIITNKLKLSLNGGASYGQSFAFVNSILNETNTTSYYPRLSIDVTPTKNMSLYINASRTWTNTKYNINTSQNQNIVNSSLGSELNFRIIKNLFFSGSYNHNFFRNNRFGVDTDIPILNGSLYLQVLPGKKGEIRLSLYDALNKNVRFSQFAGNNIVNRSSTASLARYVLLTLTYNIRGVKDSIQRDGWW